MLLTLQRIFQRVLRWNSNTDAGTAILRLSLSAVFLYFGFRQLLSPDDWTAYIPVVISETASRFFPPTVIVIFNGILEVSLGTMLLTGVLVRFSSLILGLHLLVISFSIGFNELGVRDFGLAMATISLFFLGQGGVSIAKILRSTNRADRE